MSHSEMEDELSRLVRAGDVEAVLEFVSSLPPAEHRAAAGIGRRAVDEAATSWMRAIVEGHDPPAEVDALRKTAPAVILATGSLADAKALVRKRGFGPLDAAVVVRVLRGRRPDWIEAWCDDLLEQTPAHVSLVYPLVLAGVCPRPRHDAFLLGLVELLGRGHLRLALALEAGLGAARPEAHDLARLGIREGLLADPCLLDEDLWRLLQVEGGGEYSLAAVDKYLPAERGWAATLVRCAREGRVDRQRLLDACLASLERDFAPFRAGWFSRFHDMLAPGIEECARRAEQYLRLLGSAVGPTVSAALRVLQVLDQEGRLEPEAVLRHLSPALTARAKGTALAGLRLLESAAAKDPSLATDAARLAADAVRQGAREVQDRALRLIERLGASGDEELRATMQEQVESMAPSLRGRVVEWLGEGREIEGGLSVGPPVPERDALPVRKGRGSRQAIPPIEGLDSLVERFSFVLENPAEVEDVERVLDALSRLAGDRPDDFATRVGPLAARARKLLGRTPVDVIQNEMARLAVVWATDAGPPGAPHQVESSLPGFFRRRVEELGGRLVARRPAPLLSAPTHRRAWIEPRVLVERLAAWEGGEVPLHDLVLALLRLAPERRGEALAEASRLRGEAGAAARYALGGDEEVGPTAAFWIAASVARSPGRDDPRLARRHPGLGPDAGVAACMTYTARPREEDTPWVYKRLLDVTPSPGPPGRVPCEHLPVLLHVRPGGNGFGFPTDEAGRQLPVIRWAGTVQPGHMDPFFAEGAMRIDMEWWEVAWEVRAFLEPLLDEDVPLSSTARLLLALGLGARESGQSSLALDALLAALEDGRLVPSEMGATMAQVLTTETVRVPRWRKVLEVAARHSPQATRDICLLVQHLLGSLGSTPRSDLAPLLELLYEGLVETGSEVEVPAARAWLDGMVGKNRTGVLSRRLLALRTSPKD